MVNFLGMELLDAALYSIWLHTGTLFAAVVYFRDDVLKLSRNFPSYVKNPKNSTRENRITTFLIVATSFTGLVGLPMLFLGIQNASISGAAATALIGVLLIITGILQKCSRGSCEKSDITAADSALVGGLQAFSMLPGISRSGITVSTLLLRKYDARSALKLSFLMSIPAMLVAQIGISVFGNINIEAYSVVSVLTSFVFGLLTIGALMEITGRVNFGNFCIFLGLLSLGSVLM